ncbi:MAG: TfoX protein [Polyangiaceae bacterium]|jgi:TfoX/Sxy family transcriptional regulator of competence genes|nr:TfoX protein [Polyangiaceae bacterium]
MASKQSNVDFVLEQMAGAGPVSARKMFGEYALYCREKIIALFCDDQLFVKPTEEGRAFLGKVTERAPYPGAKPWLLIQGDRCEDGEWLSELSRITHRALPPAKRKSPKRLAKPPSGTKAKGTRTLSKSAGAERSVQNPARATLVRKKSSR